MGLQCHIKVVSVGENAVTYIEYHIDKFSEKWSTLLWDTSERGPLFPLKGQHEDDLPSLDEDDFGHTWLTLDEIRNMDYSSRLPGSVGSEYFVRYFEELFDKGATHVFIHWTR